MAADIKNLPDFSNFEFSDLSECLVAGALTPAGAQRFQVLITNFYRQYGREFAWRYSPDAYKIVVSEIMLQQTQTDRVKYKFELFIQAFPDFQTLAAAEFSNVLFYWHGLGYNRRALFLHKIAQRVVNDFNGALPDLPEVLVNFGGLGPATAASICAFAFNKPVVFIETNIRTVFIHTFFRDSPDKIPDKALIPLIQATLDQDNPRAWYYALMDYGVALKKLYKNPSRKSAHHTKQSKFEGSERQIRGMILRALTAHKQVNFKELCSLVPREPARIKNNLSDLIKDGLVKKNKLFYGIS